MVVIEHSSAAAFRLPQQQQAALPNSTTITSSRSYTTYRQLHLPSLGHLLMLA